MQLGQNVKRYTKLLLTLASVPASLCIYHLIVDHMNRTLPLTEQTLLNFITENGGLELIKRGPVKINNVECDVNQYKRHANICMVLETPLKGFYKYQAEYINTKGLWRLVTSNSTAVDSPRRSGINLDWIENMKAKFALFPTQQGS